MKKIKTLLILGAIILISLAGKSQVSETFRFNNLMLSPGPTYDTLIFDVEAKAGDNTTYTTTFTIKVNFNTAVFGPNAVPVVVEPLSLVQPSGYNFNTPIISAGTNRFASTFLAFKTLPPHNGTYQIAYLSNLTTEYQGVIRYKMLITGSGDCGLELYMSGSGSMQTGNNYVLTNNATVTINYSPITAENDLLNLPSTPNTDLIISEVGDPSNSSTNFVEVYNAGSSDLDFTNYFPWFLNFDGSSSVQLTGTLAAGSAYTIAYDNVDFTPDLVSTLVGTGGSTQYTLTTYGDYASGTLIDEYDGGLSGFDYTGMHAVRHYSVTSPNTTPTLSEWVISPAEDVDMTPGSHRATLTWDGTGSDWHSQANWTEGLIPDAGHDVSIPNAGETTPIIGFGDNAYCNDLSIGGSGIGLIIESDAVDGDGSLITYGSVSGTASVQRFLGADRYWYVTQPVTSATANVFLHTWLFTYDEPTGAWSEYIEDETTPLNLMQGYAVWTSSINPWHQGWDPVGDTTTSYDGTLNTGTISTSLTAGGDGWNFVGNPYPSSVDWDAAGWTKTNLTTNAYSVWDGSTYGTYTFMSGGTNGTTQYIPAAQGFFVQASAAGTLGVTDAVRAHNALPFWKNDANMMNRLSVTISNGDINDETVIYFNENATAQLDYEYDASKLIAEAAPQAFTMLGNNKMAINTYNNTTETPSVTLGVITPIAGQYTITASNLESFNASIPIYLEDRETGTKTDLREMSTYTFTASEGTSERFVVHFTEYQGIGDNPVSDLNNIYAANHNIYVDYSGTKGEIVLYNILGQEVNRSDAFNGLNVISIPETNAIYIVKVISNTNAVTKKVFVK